MPGCGACCIAASISSEIPPGNGKEGMPGGKPAGVACVHLTADFACGIWAEPDRPAVCRSLKADGEMCGAGRGAALEYLSALERDTAPRGQERI